MEMWTFYLQAWCPEDMFHGSDGRTRLKVFCPDPSQTPDHPAMQFLSSHLILQAAGFQEEACVTHTEDSL